jgi:hypothetical protein
MERWSVDNSKSYQHQAIIILALELIWIFNLRFVCHLLFVFWNLKIQPKNKGR